MRKPDLPGTYRVVPRGGAWMLSGVRLNGTRIKVRDLSRVQAERMGAEIFGRGAPSVPATQPNPPPAPGGPIPPVELDAWGLPIRVKPENVANLNATLGVGPPPGTAQPNPEEKAKQAKRNENARSLMELAGIGWTAADVYLGRWICEKRGLEPVTPNKEQVKDLREVSKETFIEMFGDKDIKPWQMMFLLSIGIPVSMWIQSPKKKEEKAQLKAVP